MSGRFGDRDRESLVRGVSFRSGYSYNDTRSGAIKLSEWPAWGFMSVARRSVIKDRATSHGVSRSQDRVHKVWLRIGSVYLRRYISSVCM